MTCNKDLIFHVLYLKNERLLCDAVQSSLKTLQSPWKSNKCNLETNQVLFFLLLHKDIELKNRIIEGFPNMGIDSMDFRKAETFFLCLKDEVINPWLCNESLSKTNFLDNVTALYWAC